MAETGSIEVSTPPNEVLPGRYSNADNDSYHAGPGISKTHLGIIGNKSPKHYWSEYRDPKREPKRKTPTLILGGAIDAAILEPDEFPRLYAGRPEGIDGRTKDGKLELANFMAQAGRRQVLSESEFKMCMAVRDAVHAHDLCGKLVIGEKAAAFYAIDPATGLLVKCKTDNLTTPTGNVVDLKTTEDASPEAFGKAIIKYGYDVQAYWYSKVIRLVTGEPPRFFICLAVEKSPPYAMGVYYATPEMIALGEMKAERAFRRLAACIESDRWPDYAEQAQPALLPAWAFKAAA